MLDKSLAGLSKWAARDEWESHFARNATLMLPVLPTPCHPPG